MGRTTPNKLNWRSMNKSYLAQSAKYGFLTRIMLIIKCNLMMDIQVFA